MENPNHDFVRRSLRSLAASCAAFIELLERTDAVLSLGDPVSTRTTSASSRNGRDNRNGKLAVDRSRFTVTHRGKTCFLGNTIAFRFLLHLARRPNVFVSYEDLLADVWRGMRSDGAVRSVAKELRKRLRRAGLCDIATAVDGSVPRHYRLQVRA